MQTATIRDHPSTVGAPYLNMRLERLPLLAPPGAGGGLQSLFGFTLFLPAGRNRIQMRHSAAVPGAHH